MAQAKTAATSASGMDFIKKWEEKMKDSHVLLKIFEKDDPPFGTAYKKVNRGKYN